jgi:hypothetical protein
MKAPRSTDTIAKVKQVNYLIENYRMGPRIREHKLRKDLKSERFSLSSILFFTAALPQSASVSQAYLSPGWH